MQIQKLANSVLNKLEENSPYILFGIGVIAAIGAVAEAVHATTKLEAIVDDRNDKLEKVNKHFDEKVAEDEGNAQVIDQERIKEIKKINRSFTWSCVKLYAPTGLIFITSMASFGSSMYIIHNWYTGACATISTLSKAFESYRDRVREEENGDIKDYAYLHGLQLEEVEETVEDPETGKKKKVKKLQAVGTPSGLYSYRFERYDSQNDTGSIEWEPNGNTYSMPYILSVIDHRQKQLEIGKRVWLTDILEDLGFGQNVAQAGDRFAGWAPGDIILCGLEDIGGADILSKDVEDYLYGNSPDVTLTFNPRPNLYAEVYEDVPAISAKEVA